MPSYPSTGGSHQILQIVQSPRDKVTDTRYKHQVLIREDKLDQLQTLLRARRIKT